MKGGFDLVRAVRCKQRKSFISHKIVERNRLFGWVDRGSIRLTWQDLSPQTREANKIPHNRFYVIADDKYRYDIAIGEGPDEPDPDPEGEEEATGSDDEDEHPPGGEGERTISSVDAEMPLQSRKSSPGISPI